MNVARRVLISIVLVIGCGLLLGCGPAHDTASAISTATDTPTQSAAISETPSGTVTALPNLVGLPNIVGKWERHGKQDGRPYSEHFALNPDGTYSIEARFDDTSEVLASASGTYEVTETTLTMTDTNGATSSTPYYFDSSGRLIIDNKPESAWTRVQ